MAEGPLDRNPGISVGAAMVFMVLLFAVLAKGCHRTTPDCPHKQPTCASPAPAATR